MVKITIFDLFTNEPPSWPRPLGTERHGTTRPGKREEKTDGKITMLLMGKSTISMAMFNSELLIYQRVCGFVHKWGIRQNCGNFIWERD